jgi:hypothetical protein
MTPAFSYPDKPRRGDAVAVLSPSAGLPARFPRPYEHVIPSGGTVTVDGGTRQIEVTY